MFRKKKSKEIDEARDVSIREGIEGDAYGPSPNGHVMGESDEEQDDHEFNAELHSVFEQENEETREGEQAFPAESNDDARPATEDDAVDKLNTIWRQRLKDDPDGALDEVRARMEELGYGLAYAGRTFGETLTKRVYYIMDPDERVPLDVFHSGDVDLTLLEVCIWSEVAIKRWKNS